MIALAKNEVIFEAKEAISFLTHKKTALPRIQLGKGNLLYLWQTP
jgi:hypothetical protein